MEPSDLLLTFAQVSIAFAGFASLIAIIGMRTSLGTPGFDLLRYWVMLEFSLAALALSLLPPVLILLALNDGWVWRSLSGVAAVFAVAHNAVMARLYFKGNPSVRGGATMWNQIGANLVYAAIVLTQIGNAAGLLEPAVGWYMLGVFLVLLVASAHFILFIANALRSFDLH